MNIPRPIAAPSGFGPGGSFTANNFVANNLVPGKRLATDGNKKIISVYNGSTKPENYDYSSVTYTEDGDIEHISYYLDEVEIQQSWYTFDEESGLLVSIVVMEPPPSGAVLHTIIFQYVDGMLSEREIF